MQQANNGFAECGETSIETLWNMGEYLSKRRCAAEARGNR